MTTIEDSSGREVQGFIVKFDKNGGTTEAVPQTINVKAPESTVAKLPKEEPELKGSVFTCWNTQVDGSGEVFRRGTRVTANLTVFAQWQEVPPGSPIVTFDTNLNAGQEGLYYDNAYPRQKAVISPYVSVGSLPDPPVLEGHNFVGWYPAEDGSGEEFTDATEVSDSIPVYAQWKIIEYTVIFDANQGDKPADPLQKTLTWPEFKLGDLNSLPQRTGYTFDGWNTKADGSGLTYTEAAIVDADVTLYAQWKKLPELPSVQYTVTFSANGADGTEPDPITVYADARIQLPGAGALSKVNCRFGGWNTQTDGKGTNYDAEADYKVSKDITLYANWIRQYTVTYNGNGATGGTAPGAQTVEAGTSIILAYQGTLSKTGFSFTGWTDGNGIDYSANESYQVTGDVTFSAQWEIIRYTVVFNANGATGGSAPVDQTVDAGLSITIPGDNGLSRNGYTFGGWSISASGNGTAYSAGESFTPVANTTLYAKWDQVNQLFKVTFQVREGTWTNENTEDIVETVQSGGTVSSFPENPVREGYKFGGWYYEDPPRDDWPSYMPMPFLSALPVTKDTVVYAMWNK